MQRGIIKMVKDQHSTAHQDSSQYVYRPPTNTWQETGDTKLVSE